MQRVTNAVMQERVVLVKIAFAFLLGVLLTLLL
jgi:hypothetical protein